MPAAITAITATRLVDGTGGPPLADPVVIVEGERIKAVGTSSGTPIPREARVLDLGGRTLMPGLIDAHAHFYGSTANNWVLVSIEPSQRKLIRGVVDVGRLLQAGFTAVRDMGYRDSIYLKQAIEAGEIPGPRMAVPRMMITPTGGSPDPHWLPVEWVQQHDYRCRLADGVDEVRKAAREQLREGADFLKVMASGGINERKDLQNSYLYTLEELRAIVEEARKVGVMVAVHAYSAAARLAVQAGVDTIELGTYIDEETLDLMAERGAIFVPTLSNSYMVAHSGPESGAPAANISRGRAFYEDRLLRVRMARERGVRVAAGTDFGMRMITRHGHNALEAELLTNAGLSPAEALVAATRHAAAAMGRERDLGTVEAGKYADLVATDANPLEDIRALRGVSFVMKGGRVVRDEPGAMRAIHPTWCCRQASAED